MNVDKKHNPQSSNLALWVMLIALFFQMLTAVSYHHNINQVWDEVHQMEEIQLHQSQLLNQRLMIQDQRLALLNQRLMIQRERQLLEIVNYLESLIDVQ